MNLHSIAGPIIAAVNPFVPAVIQINAGSYETLADGTRVPQYFDPITVAAQVQPLQFRDIQMLDALNIQGTRMGIYLYGQVDGLVRSTGKGGDLITILGGVNRGVWLVAVMAEQWQGWCKALCTLQNESPGPINPNDQYPC